MTDNDGASDTDSVAVKANVAPVAALTTTPSPATGKAPLSVTFNGSTSSDSDGTIASWSLSFGDGSAAAPGAARRRDDRAAQLRRRNPYRRS